MHKKIFIILAIAAVLFTGCKKEAANTDTENNDLQNTIDSYTDDLVVNDYEGYDFRILIRPGQTSDQYVEEGSSNPIEDAVY